MGEMEKRKRRTNAEVCKFRIVKNNRAEWSVVVSGDPIEIRKEITKINGVSSVVQLDPKRTDWLTVNISGNYDFVSVVKEIARAGRLDSIPTAFSKALSEMQLLTKENELRK